MRKAWPNTLFNFLLRRDIRDQTGIVIEGEKINNMRYADDTVILVENIDDLH